MRIYLQLEPLVRLVWHLQSSSIASRGHPLPDQGRLKYFITGPILQSTTSILLSATRHHLLQESAIGACLLPNQRRYVEVELSNKADGTNY